MLCFTCPCLLCDQGIVLGSATSGSFMDQRNSEVIAQRLLVRRGVWERFPDYGGDIIENIKQYMSTLENWKKILTVLIKKIRS